MPLKPRTAKPATAKPATAAKVDDGDEKLPFDGENLVFVLGGPGSGKGLEKRKHR